MVNMENYEEYMLLYADGELSKEEEQALLDFVALHPKLKAELDAYAATRLQPDMEVVFADKESLIKTAGGGRTMTLGNWKAYAAAACLLVFAVVFYMNQNDLNDDGSLAAYDKVTAQDSTPQPVTKTPETTTTTITETEHKTEKKLQSSKPVDAVAMEQKTNRQPVKQVQPSKPVVKEQPVVKEEPKEVVVVKNEPVTKMPTEVKTPVATVAATTKPATLPDPIEPAVQAPVAKSKNNFVASVIADKVGGLEQIGEAVNDKLVAARNIREEIKDTEVRFRIGKKELFSVRL